MSGIPVVDRLRSVLERGQESGELRAGSRLPTERAFAESLSVPRSAVRQALGVLEREGLISRHVGRGTFLTTDGGHVDAQELMTSPAEIMDTRLMIEPEIAIHAARNATPSDLAEIERCMRRGNACEPYLEFEAWDSAFHRAIAASVHNGLLLRMFDTMNAARDLPVWGNSKLRSATKDRRVAYEQEHAAILTALADRDPGSAQVAMREHLNSVKSNLLNPPR
ncbi:FadR/GntR family transcriptional regulator [Amycolatopsis sp. GM8]|uniref:FadR/GntR family transcriptional regulator n=1 Tax=Amycolatopsis sp. GM8 TaxID=2896530 RepID=UPI001F3F9D0B|nr:FCD domain-containing protein [Amycolatopsis sp. GM8]